MINSVYEALDAYKRQGRINVQAALQSFLSYPNMTEVTSKRITLTPDIEFTIDVFAIANEKLGRLFGRGHTDEIDWGDVFTLMRESIEQCEEYWRCHGWIHSAETNLDYVLRHYLCRCVWYYNTRGKEEFPYYNSIVDVVVPDVEDNQGIRQVMKVDGPYYFLPRFINGIQEQDVREMYEYYQGLRNGNAVGGDLSQFVFRSELLGYGLEAFVCYDSTDGSGTTWASDHFLDSMQVFRPDLAKWLRNPEDLSNCLGDNIYGIMTNQAIYFCGVAGVKIDPRFLPRSVLRDLLSEMSCLGRAWAPPRFYSGLTYSHGVMLAEVDITAEMHEHLGWKGGSRALWNHTVCGGPLLPGMRTDIDDWKD